MMRLSIKATEERARVFRALWPMDEQIEVALDQHDVGKLSESPAFQRFEFSKWEPPVLLELAYPGEEQN